MQIYGIDFTSAPSRSKPITVASCSLDGDSLSLDSLLKIPTLAQFERDLAQPGEWIAGLDFPFGMPRKLITEVGWPEDWAGYVEEVAGLGKRRFENLLTMYKEARSPGHREHRRATDEHAGALSPMKLFGVPLAKMFFQGAPRLAASELNVLPCRPTGDPRTVIEIYPALAARNLLRARRGYKKDARHGDSSARRNARRDLVAALSGRRAASRYGITMVIGRHQGAELIDDAAGDLLDAALGALQTAWAWQRRDAGYGIPEHCDALEGWIVDPMVV